MNDVLETRTLPDALPDDPMPLAASWLDAATAGNVQRNPNAMTVVSVAANGCPSARVVLCKDFVVDPGYLVFYTNYNSRKCVEFADNANAAALFHWDVLGRQIRVEGTVMRSPDTESDAYFASRDRGSQLGAWGSDQSAPIASKSALVAQIIARGEELGLKFSDGAEELVSENAAVIARPPHWGGLRLWATAVELWVEGADRIHDRAQWTRECSIKDDGVVAAGRWTGSRLQP